MVELVGICFNLSNTLIFKLGIGVVVYNAVFNIHKLQNINEKSQSYSKRWLNTMDKAYQSMWYLMWWKYIQLSQTWLNINSYKKQQI